MALAHLMGLGLMQHLSCLLYTSDAADERSSVDLGGRRIIKQKKKVKKEEKKHTTKRIEQIELVR